MKTETLTGALVCLLLFATLVAGCGPASESQESGRAPGLRVTRLEMGKAWPLNVSSGEVSCQGSRDAGALLFSHDGRRFALNGLALSWKLAPDLKTSGFWSDDPQFPGSKLSIDSLQEKARSTCGK